MCLLFHDEQYTHPMICLLLAEVLYYTICSVFIYVASVVLRGSQDPGSGPIFLDELDCTATDTMIVECNLFSNGLGFHNCNHSMDVSVRCTGIVFIVALFCLASCVWVTSEVVGFGFQILMSVCLGPESLTTVTRTVRTLLVASLVAACQDMNWKLTMPPVLVSI